MRIQQMAFKSKSLYLMFQRSFACMVFAMLAMCDSYAITIDEARQLAIERYPTIRDYNLIELTKEYTLDNASKAWLPQIGVAAHAIWQSDVASYPAALAEMLEQRGMKIKGMNRFQWKGAFDIQQMIWDGGRVKAVQEVSICESVESSLSNEIELYQLRQQIDELFFGILLLDQQTLSIQATISLLQANVDKVESLVRNGAAMQCDADVIEAELLTARQQLVSLQCTAESYRNILTLYIGDRAMEGLQTPEAILPAIDNDGSNRPEAKLLTARQHTLQARLAQLDNATMPHLSAFAQGYYGYPSMNFMEAMMNHKPSINAMIGVSLAWNISSLYTKRNNQQLLNAMSQRIELAREVFDFNIDVQSTKQRNELRRLQQIAASDEEILMLRRRVRIAAEARLREGMVEPTYLLKSITEEENASIAANTHRIEYIRATYRLQFITNK